MVFRTKVDRYLHYGFPSTTWISNYDEALAYMAMHGKLPLLTQPKVRLNRILYPTRLALSNKTYTVIGCDQYQPTLFCYGYYIGPLYLG